MRLMRGPCQSGRFLSLISIAIIVFLGWALLNRREHIKARLRLRPSGLPERTEPLRVTVAHGSCQPEVELLRRPWFGLTDKIKYSRRCIKPVWNPDVDVREVISLDQPLMSARTMTVDLTSCGKLSLEPCDTIALEVPYPSSHKKKFPHLIFAVASTYDRLEDSLPTFEHCLSGSGSTLIAIVVDGGPPNDVKALEALYASRHIDLRAILPSRRGLSSNKHHFALIEDLLAAASSTTHWLAIIDDDTFFPSLPALSTALANYNHQISTWLGALSEDSTAVERWGVQAFGGAGIFLSVPLARKLVPHIDSCLDATTSTNGDKILQDCITAHAPDTKLTIVPGLWQLDIMGDATGFYEAARSRPLLSLHHWKSWHKVPVLKMAAVADICGDCFLQRWKFADGVMLVNGFSVAKYSPKDMLQQLNLEKMEPTWSQAEEGFVETLGPYREQLGPEKKKSWKLEEVVQQDDGDLRQIYVYRGDTTMGEIDEVLEIVWEAVGMKDTH